MKYICLAYEEESMLNALTNDEWSLLRKETLDYVEKLKKSSRLLAAEPLQSIHKAASVRMRNGRLSITDGPFAETKESLGGFFLIEANDMSEAIDIASKWPSARFGTIEVRPIEEGLKEDRRY